MILTAETEPEARLKHQLDDLERMLHQLTVLDRADGPEELNRAIDELLCCMGDYTHADRAYLFAFLERNGIYRNTNEWCAEGVMPQIDNLQEKVIYMQRAGFRHHTTHPFFPASSSSSPMFPLCARSCRKHCPNAANNDKKRPEILI